MKSIFSLLILLFFTLSCQFQKAYWKDGQYAVYENEGLNYCKSLYFAPDNESGGYELVNCINNFGVNENYILVESISENERSPNEFWIIKKIKESDYGLARENMLGPFSENAFKTKRSEMGLDNLKLNVDLK